MVCLWWYSRYLQSIDEVPYRYLYHQGGILVLLHLYWQIQVYSWLTILRIVGMQDTWCHHSWKRVSSLCRGLQYQDDFRKSASFEWVTVTYLSESIWSGFLHCKDKPCNQQWETSISHSWTWTWQQTGQWWWCCWLASCYEERSLQFCLKLQLTLTAFIWIDFDSQLSRGIDNSLKRFLYRLVRFPMIIWLAAITIVIVVKN